MRKNPHPQSGRFNPRIAAALVLGLTGTCLAMLSFAAPGTQAPVAGVVSAGPTVVPSEFNGDVRDLPQTVTDIERNAFNSRPDFERPDFGPKPILPGAALETPSPDVSAISAPMPNPIMSFPGMDFNTWGAGHPPDTVGDVGPNHFVQAVNTSIGIYDKNTGAALANFTFDSLWNGAATGTSCDMPNGIHGGDPTVIYDPQHDRFIVADFSWVNFTSGPFYECVAVSKTSDPVNGGWWLYGIRADDAAHPWFPDYPKMGIWPDGLYMTANMFDSKSTFREARAYAFNISDLVAGAILHSVVADTNSSQVFSLLPSNYRGTQPAAGTPNYMVTESTTAFFWDVYTFHVDYSTPANSTFLGPTHVLQASSVSAPSSVPEPSGNNTDTLANQTMMQNQYRNIGGVESLWVNQTTGTPSSSTPTGIQWAQINVTGGNVSTTPVQEQIFNNGLDGMNRFMGSLAVDHAGNMALGYTASSSSVAPDIRYTGRLAADPLNSLPQTEVTMLPGITPSVQTGICGSHTCTRWGDYSAMTVDPVDDCTFWYTNMYYSSAGLNWQTRVGSFKFPTCSAGPAPTPTPTPTPGGSATPTPTPTATPSSGPAVMLSPAPGSTFTSSSVTFQWSAGSATSYSLIVGSTAGRSDIYSSGVVQSLSATVNNIPTDGRTIYVTLYSQVNGSWVSNSYTYNAFTASPTATPTPTPTPGGTPTPTPTPSATPTPTPTTTPTPVPTPTPTATPISTVDTPTFSPNSGTFRRRVTVEIFCTTPGATIYYTIDGTTPTTSSLVYNGSGVTLSGRGKKTLKAIGSEPGYNDSAVGTANFTIR